jgi:signal transduction histidine kinase
MGDAPRPRDYVAAAGLAALALLARALLDRWLGSLQPFSSGFVAVAAAVWFLGWRPAALTAILSYGAAALLFVEPRGRLLPVSGARDLTALLTFLSACAMIIAIGNRARKAERALARANAELRETDQRKDAFLATLSHELRNPVGVIGNAVAMLQAQNADPATRATLAVLARQTAHIRRLLDDLLDVGRIARGRLELRTAPSDVRECVQHAVDANQYALAQKQQSIAIEAPSEPVIARVDQARMLQVVSNLIDNASKYSPTGSRVEIRVSDGPAVSIEVRDNGPGIDEQALPRLFDLFDQGGRSPSDGLGLGLGLCKHLVEMHGGTISAARNPDGRGTTFCVRLPLGDELPPDTRRRSDGQPPADVR